MGDHRFEKSMPYNSSRGCVAGYHKRTEYTTAAGTYVPTRCVKSTSPYEQSSKDFKRSTLRKMNSRLDHIHDKSKDIHCPKGYISRAPYARRYTTSIRQKGYTVKKASGTTYKVYPKNTTVYAPASCVKDLGKPGKGVPEGEGIGPLRKGEITKFGYSSKNSTETRHLALRKAILQLGVLSTYRKLDAVAKLSLRIAPDSSRIFAADRDWVLKTFGTRRSG
jgi:Family of unknown function (DUF5771)